ncbi:MAG: universal stress protein [Rhodanobacteraceae bacterium]|jgi:nucleotide-binding universal stress UspA family protein|nr:universal stress protein [Rhodanobacteraceae bacterium]
MYTHILVPVDGSALSDKALDHALQLARGIGARVSTLHVVTNFVGDAGFEVPLLADTAREAFQQRAIDEAESILARAARQGEAQGVPVGTHYVLASDPSRVIVDETERRGCDLIVMASHGRRGLEALLLGSETQKVLTHCKVPVLVVRG